MVTGEMKLRQPLRRRYIVACRPTLASVEIEFNPILEKVAGGGVSLKLVASSVGGNVVSDMNDVMALESSPPSLHVEYLECKNGLVSTIFVVVLLLFVFFLLLFSFFIYSD